MGRGEVVRINELEQKVRIVELEIEKLKLGAGTPTPAPQPKVDPYPQQQPPAPLPVAPAPIEETADATPQEVVRDIYTTPELEKIKSMEEKINSFKHDLMSIKTQMVEFEKKTSGNTDTTELATKVAHLEESVNTLQSIPVQQQPQTADSNIMSLFTSIENIEKDILTMKADHNTLVDTVADQETRLLSMLEMIQTLEKGSNGTDEIKKVNDAITKMKKDITTNKSNITKMKKK